MLHPRGAAATLAVLVLSAVPLEGQDLSKYRDFSLGTSLAAVVAASGARAEDAKTLHARPAIISELEWRTIYSRPAGSDEDAVRRVVFSFYDDQLYRVVVTYDPERTAGLTDADLIRALSELYGPPLPVTAGRTAPRESAACSADAKEATMVRCWNGPEEALTLLRGDYAGEVGLVLMSKRLSQKASSATKEAIRLDAAEAPQRAKAQAAKAAAEARAATDKARLANRATFRP
jgi:hypothetical protein